ncbi:hypothetical protein [uncultured Clostridium sp.]|uniref:hypothetical protein n=1 Tax=uncultured Clostridium sp. TaxID=59620 RepID=UPI00260D40A9|nr:hypothetical protein [uncultured Clostridium sp.]
MEYVYGKLNQQLEQIEYKGSTTDTATTYVNNDTHTITVDVLKAGSANTDGLLSFNKYQDLTPNELKKLYSNIKLNDYINESNAILSNTEKSQIINSDLTIAGRTEIEDNYIYLNSNNKDSGIYISNWMDNKDAKIYINKNGELRYNYDTNGINSDQIILTAINTKNNKFVYYDGHSLSTREIMPVDIYQDKDYLPSNPYQITNKLYVDNSIRKNGNYSIVATNTDFTQIVA